MTKVLIANLFTGGVEIRLKVFIPDDKDDFLPSKVYYLFDNDVFVRYDAQNNRLVELPNV